MKNIYNKNENNVGNIYETQRDDIVGNICETQRDDIEGKFVDAICEIVVDALKVGWNDQRIVKPLLIRILNEELNNHYPKDQQGLLQQYETYILDKSTERLIKDLDLGDAKVNHDYALHSKLDHIINAIKLKIK